MKYFITCVLLSMSLSVLAQEPSAEQAKMLESLQQRQTELNGLMTQLQALRQELSDLQQMLNVSDEQIEQKLSQIKDLEKQLKLPAK